MKPYYKWLIVRIALWLLCIAFWLSVSIYFCGCANIKLSKTLPDGTIYKAQYSRFMWQSIDGFEAKTPDGWEVSFDKQKSDFELALELAGVKVGAGGKK